MANKGKYVVQRQKLVQGYAEFTVSNIYVVRLRYSVSQVKRHKRTHGKPIALFISSTLARGVADALNAGQFKLFP